MGKPRKGKPRKQLPDGYYDVADVARILEKSQASVYRDAKAGDIPFELPEGKKIGMMFPKEAIDVLTKRLRKQRTEQHALHLRFLPSTRADIWTAVKNAQRIYGLEDSISFERALEWRDINPDLSMSVKQDEELLAGMVTLLPLEEDIILALARDSMREKDIPDAAIRRWSDPDLSVYIAGIAVIPSGDRQIDRQLGRFLLAHAIKWAIMLSAECSIKNWYGIGVTPDGQSLLEELGFHEFLSLEEGKRKAYILDNMLSNPARLVQRFLARMEPA